MTTDTAKKLKIVFLGTPDFVLPALESMKAAELMPHLVITAPDAPKGRFLRLLSSPVKEWAVKNGIAVLQPEKLKDEKFLAGVRGHGPDLFVVASYGKIMPKALLDIPKYGTINIHPSLLPKYRGASPVAGALLAGEKETGVTIMLVDEEMDHGPIIAARKIGISPEDTTGILEKKLFAIGGEMLVEIILPFIVGKINPQEQKHSLATFTKKITKEDGKINWNDSAETIRRQTQAFNPWPGAYTFWRKGGKKIRLILSGIESIVSGTEKKAGEVFELDGRMAIAARDGAVVIKTIKPEGKSEMPARAFLCGNSDILGQVLE